VQIEVIKASHGEAVRPGEQDGGLALSSIDATDPFVLKVEE
jgi:hypothetical protein